MAETAPGFTASGTALLCLALQCASSGIPGRNDQHICREVRLCARAQLLFLPWRSRCMPAGIVSERHGILRTPGTLVCGWDPASVWCDPGTDSLRLALPLWTASGTAAQDPRPEDPEITRYTRSQLAQVCDPCGLCHCNPAVGRDHPGYASAGFL